MQRRMSVMSRHGKHQKEPGSALPKSPMLKYKRGRAQLAPGSSVDPKAKIEIAAVSPYPRQMQRAVSNPAAAGTPFPGIRSGLAHPSRNTGASPLPTHLRAKLSNMKNEADNQPKSLLKNKNEKPGKQADNEAPNSSRKLL